MVLSRVLAGAAVLLVLAGCGDTYEVNSKSGPDQAALYRQLAKCVRDHGVPDFPDPVQDGDGRWGLPEGASAPPQEVQNACKSIIDQVQQETQNKPASASTIAALRKFTGCMRQNGIADWPDPDADGVFSLPARLSDPKNHTLFDAQFNTCKSNLPPGGLNMRPAK
ncbi:hypothetical protein ABZ860_36125 [Microbispora sp. NPDC046973]|uniref:hypothetical protein n=1 Tax=Microbispora sp. NPDC046973 TaxID=3155022 RepID=UPI0033F001E4